MAHSRLVERMRVVEVERLARTPSLPRVPGLLAFLTRARCEACARP